MEKVLAILVFVSMTIGQLGAIELTRDVTVYIHDFAVSIYVLYFLLLIVKGASKKYVLGTAIGLFALASLLSIFINAHTVSQENVVKGSLYLLRWVLYSGMYFSVARSRLSSVFWTRGIIYTGTAFSILGLGQFVLYPDLRNLMHLGWDPHYYRLFSTLLDPNYVGILISSALLLLLISMKEYRSLGLFIALAINAAAVVLTYSRSSYVAFICGIMTWIFMRRQFRIGFYVIIVFLIAVLYIPRAGTEALRLDRLDSAVSRLSNYRESMAAFVKRPFFGYGFNLLRYSLASPSQDSQFAVSRAGAGVDSSILFVLLTTGSLGGLFYAYLLLKIWRLAGEGMLRPILVGFLVHSIFVNSLFYPWCMLWLWVLIGARERELITHVRK